MLNKSINDNVRNNPKPVQKSSCNQDSSDTRFKFHSNLDLETHSKVTDIADPKDQNNGLYCGLKRRYTNRENKLAKQLLEHIKTEKKWTNSVDKPFVLGI